MHTDNFSEMEEQKLRKVAWFRSRNPYEIWYSLKHISKTIKN